MTLKVKLWPEQFLIFSHCLQKIHWVKFFMQCFGFSTQFLGHLRNFSPSSCACQMGRCKFLPFKVKILYNWLGYLIRSGDHLANLETQNCSNFQEFRNSEVGTGVWIQFEADGCTIFTQILARAIFLHFDCFEIQNWDYSFHFCLFWFQLLSEYIQVIFSRIMRLYRTWSQHVKFWTLLMMVQKDTNSIYVNVRTFCRNFVASMLAFIGHLPPSYHVLRNGKVAVLYFTA